MSRITRKTYGELEAELLCHVPSYFKIFMSDNIVYSREYGIIWPIMSILDRKVHLIFALEKFQREYPNG